MIWPPEIESARALARLDRGVDQISGSDAASQTTVRERHATHAPGNQQRRHSAIALGFAVLATGVALAITTAARGDSTPIGPLPPGTSSTITTSPSQLVAVALPHASSRSGLVWRLARRYDTSIVRQISEADVNANVVLVFKVLGRGKTSLVFGLTHGDTSSKAVKSATHTVISR
jgi:hypothetical protein